MREIMNVSIFYTVEPKQSSPTDDDDDEDDDYDYKKRYKWLYLKK